MRLLFFIMLVSLTVNAQQSILPMNSFYKDQIFANKGIDPLNNGSFFPISQSTYNLEPLIADSSKQYYDFTHILFQKHLVEIKGEDYKITIDPAVVFSGGQDLIDTSERKLFQNTRGIYIDVNLFKNFSFFTTFYENQARFSDYQSEYYSGLGELYPNPQTYNTQNAFIPGEARTKPFDGDAFDYAFAVGAMTYKPFETLEFMAGNNQQFIGNGYRSILLSDNNGNSPYFRVNWSITPKFRFNYLRSRHLNLLRRPATSSVESYYESKGYAVNYFTFTPNPNLEFSLFEGSVWSRGDSINSTFSNPLAFNPIPGISKAIGGDNVSSFLGLNIGAQLGKKHRVYSQIAIPNYNFSMAAVQFGYRGYEFFQLPELMLQVEYNYVPSGFYNNENPRLNYINNNSPLAHIKGQGFQEFLTRISYEYKRVYLSQSLSYYMLENYNPLSILPLYQTLEYTNGKVINSQTELGYRFNRKMNLMLFTRLVIRTDANDKTNQIVSFGLKTGFTNKYTDF